MSLSIWILLFLFFLSGDTLKRSHVSNTNRIHRPASSASERCSHRVDILSPLHHSRDKDSHSFCFQFVLSCSLWLFPSFFSSPSWISSVSCPEFSGSTPFVLSNLVHIFSVHFFIVCFVHCPVLSVAVLFVLSHSFCSILLGLFYFGPSSIFYQVLFRLVCPVSCPVHFCLCLSSTVQVDHTG